MFIFSLPATSMAGEPPPPPTLMPAGPGAPKLPVFVRPAPAADRIVPSLDEEPESNRRWYGWQTLLVNAASVGVMAAAAAANNETLFWAGAVPLTLGGPAVHFFHDNYAEGILSLGLHAGTPALLALGGGAAMCSVNGDCDSPLPVSIELGPLAADMVPDILRARKKYNFGTILAPFRTHLKIF